MFCSKCGHANGEGARFCVKCGAPLAVLTDAADAQPASASPSPPSAAPMPPAASDAGTVRTAGVSESGRRVTGKNPVVALVLSFFLGGLGIGQFYNGDWKKGLAMLAATLLLGFATGGLVPVAIWIWSMVDAYQVASGAWRPW